jgi:DNA-binding response OmpR family regulator
MQIVYIEDEPKMGRLVARSLTEAGYDCHVLVDGAEGYNWVRTHPVDLAIVDHLLPTMTGREICRALRGEGHSLPILMLTASSGLEDTVAGLDAGADDYLIKPFELEVLLARVRALLRRRSATSDVLAVGDITLNTRTREVHIGDRQVSLSDREFRLLDHMMRRPGQVIARAEIMSDVWGLAFDSKTNVVEVYVNYLRSKLDPSGGDSVIKTVRGMGYRIG